MPPAFSDRRSVLHRKRSRAPVINRGAPPSVMGRRTMSHPNRNFLVQSSAAVVKRKISTACKYLARIAPDDGASTTPSPAERSAHSLLNDDRTISDPPTSARGRESSLFRVRCVQFVRFVQSVCRQAKYALLGDHRLQGKVHGGLDQPAGVCSQIIDGVLERHGGAIRAA